MNKKPFLLHISLEDKIVFCKNLSLLLRSGITLAESLNILKENIKSKTLKYILSIAIEDIQKGQYLANTFGKFENVFGKFFIEIIRIGELTGTLAENLERLGDEFKKIETLRRKAITTLIYPAFIIVTMIIMIIFLLYFVFPKISPIFENLGVELPLSTKIFLAASNFLVKNGIYIFLAIFILLAFFIFSLRFYSFRYFFHYLLLKTPIISNLIKNYTLAEFSRIFALLLNSGIKIVESFEICSKSINNEIYKKVFKEAAEFVTAGHPAHEFFEKYPNLFFYNFVKMIEIGERTGNLENNLQYLAKNLEENVDTFLERFVNILEPIILVIIAILIGFMAIAVVLPIYELSEKLQP